MSIPGLGFSKCVLLMSDEGINVYDASSNRVSIVETIPWDTQDFEDGLIEIISSKCKGRSVILLNDAVEQHYRKERVPKFGALDRVNVIKRRLNAAFPTYPMKASLKLKEKAPAKTKEDGLSGDIYLFAAVPQTENIKKVLNALKKSHASVSGLALLPIESAGIGVALSKKISRSSEKPAVWTLFVGQHKSGGLRQIVTKNGELALTRMTPISESNLDIDIWASEVSSEIKGTMSYLSRFGYDPRDGLDVIVIADNSAGATLAEKIDFDCNFSVITASEAANALGVRAGFDLEDRYAEDIHVAWLAKKGSITLPLESTLISEITTTAKAVMAAMIVLGLGCSYLAFNTFNLSRDVLKVSGDLNLAKQGLEAAKIEHASELERTKSSGYDFNVIDGTVNAYKFLELSSMKPLPVFDKIGRALGPDLNVSSMIVKPIDVTTDGASVSSPAPDGSAPEVSEKPEEFEIVLKFVFPGDLEPEKGVVIVEEIESRIKQELPGHDVEIIKQVADLSYTGNFVGEATSQEASTEKAENYEAEIKITGSLL